MGPNSVGLVSYDKEKSGLKDRLTQREDDMKTQGEDNRVSRRTHL